MLFALKMPSRIARNQRQRVISDRRVLIIAERAAGRFADHQRPTRGFGLAPSGRGALTWRARSISSVMFVGYLGPSVFR
jgi:hypothetical protein